MQVKLLRLVQEKTVRPVGEAREQSVDVRILSATHKNLADLVAQGLFREDLFYRINVIEPRVPALRERRGDIGETAGAICSAWRGVHTEAPELSLRPCECSSLMPFPVTCASQNALERAMTLSTGGVARPDYIRVRRPREARTLRKVSGRGGQRGRGPRPGKSAREHRA